MEDKWYVLYGEDVKLRIKICEAGKHIQQVAYSTHHDALTQVCFNCKTISTTMKKKEMKKK